MKASPRLVREKISEIIEKEGMTLESFGNTIGVSKNMISSVLRRKSNLGRENVHKFCLAWGIEYESLLEEELKIVSGIGEFVNQVIHLKKVKNDELVEKTGIDLLSLSQIKRGIRGATQEELQKLCEVLEIDYSMVDEGKIAQGFHILEHQMRQMHFTDESIERVVRVLNEELKNRRYS